MLHVVVRKTAWRRPALYELACSACNVVKHANVLASADHAIAVLALAQTTEQSGYTLSLWVPSSHWPYKTQRSATFSPHKGG